MKQKELKFDLDKINEMKTKMSETAIELDEYKKNILDSLEILKNDWNTMAGTKFMTTVNKDWTIEVDKYIKIVGAVESLLEEASKQYATVEDEIGNLKFYP